MTWDGLKKWPKFVYMAYNIAILSSSHLGFQYFITYMDIHLMEVIRIKCNLEAFVHVALFNQCYVSKQDGNAMGTVFTRNSSSSAPVCITFTFNVL